MNTTHIYLYYNKLYKHETPLVRPAFADAAIRYLYDVEIIQFPL